MTEVSRLELPTTVFEQETQTERCLVPLTGVRIQELVRDRVAQLRSDLWWRWLVRCSSKSCPPLYPSNSTSTRSRDSAIWAPGQPAGAIIEADHAA